MTLYNATALAVGWRSVAVASSKDKARPALNRTVSIESFSSGCRLTATDSVTLLTTWVANVEDPFAEPPDLDEAPLASAVAIDPHGRAKGLLAHAQQLVGQDEDLDLEVSLTLGVVDQIVDDVPAFDGMDPAWVEIQIPYQERLRLRAYEGEFPNWRSVIAGHRPQVSDRVALHPDRLAQMAKVGTLAGAHVRCTLAGELGGVRVVVPGEVCSIDGLVMPVRWDFDTDAPVDQADDDLEDEGDEPGPVERPVEDFIAGDEGEVQA